MENIRARTLTPFGLQLLKIMDFGIHHIYDTDIDDNRGVRASTACSASIFAE